jgi:DNA-binding CsgD family transcriptional regulator/tetratricopeptide (TPR) repeat protein
MTRLRAALAQAEAGTASAVLASGDAGVGKSRLFGELGREAERRGALVLSGRCLDVGETGLPYLPFVEALIELRRLDPAAVAARPPLSRLLPGTSLPAAQEQVSETPPPGRPGVQVERDLGQLQLFDALLELLTELAETRCVVLIVEDLHWADSSTRDLLSFLLSRLRSQRLLVLASYRSDDLHRRHPLRPLLAELVRLPAVERLELGPFDAEETRRFVAALADETVTNKMIQQITARSEGNAFFAEELLEACAYVGADRVPDGLVDVLLSRVERLSPAAQELVRLISVAGRRVVHTRLQGVTQAAGIDIEDALREAVQRNVLVVNDQAEEYAFRHALMREAVYGELLPGERVRLHAKFAKYLAAQPESRGVAAALAHHSLQSHDLRTALVASVRAADEAERIGAPAESLRHIEQALKLWDAVSAEDRQQAGLLVAEYELLRTASYLAATAGQPERAVAFGRSAVAKLGPDVEPEQAAHSQRRLAQALSGVEGRQDEAIAAMERAWELVRDRPASATRAWVLAVRAVLLRKKDREAAREAAEAAIADARCAGNGGAEADALATLGVLNDNAGQAPEAIEHFTAAVRRAGETHAIGTELRARYFLALHSYDRGELAEAARGFDEGAARARTSGANWSTYGIELRLLQVTGKYTSGDWDGSQQAGELPSRQVSDMIVARLAAAGALVQVGRGRFEEAARLLGVARPHWHHDLEIPLNSGYAAIEMAVWQGDLDAVTDWTQDVLAELDHYPSTWILGAIRLSALGLAGQVELVRRARRNRNTVAVDRSVAMADTLVERARGAAQNGQAWSGTLGPEGRGWLAVAVAERTRVDGPGDPASWQEAVREFGYGNTYQQAVCRLRYAEALLGADERDQATTELALAATAASGLGADPLSAAIAELAHRGRLSVPGVTEQRSQLDPFTPRERAVLSLVALGRTNRQVGEELYISEKTVSVHLSRIMTKLGANRRAEAVATAYERGLLEPARE